MSARLTHLGETPLVEAWADIDHSTCEAFGTALADALASGGHVAMVDLTRVGYIDSGGLSVLFSSARRLPEGGWLGLIGPNANVRRLLEIVGLLADHRFRLFDDRAAAEASSDPGKR